MLTHRLRSSEDTTPTTLPMQSLLGIDATRLGSMAERLDLQSKASLDSALQGEAFWICAHILASGQKGEPKAHHKTGHIEKIALV